MTEELASMNSMSRATLAKCVFKIKEKTNSVQSEVASSKMYEAK